MEDWDNRDLIVQDVFMKNHLCESCTIFSEHKFLVFNWFSMLSQKIQNFRKLHVEGTSLPASFSRRAVSNFGRFTQDPA